MGLIEGVVLAGGRSSRMGQDKARMLVKERPLAAWVADALEPWCTRVRYSRRTEDDWPLPVIVDPEDLPRHALCGVVAGLQVAETPEVLFSPCDLPDLRSADLQPLVVGEGPRRARGQPLLCVLPVSWAERLTVAIRAGESVGRALAQAREVPLRPGALRNANRPEDLQASADDSGSP